jgi:predicted anti-sigma-YlaC factor YlaD
MSADLHARAQSLIAQERVEGVSCEQHQWLQEHLRECASCARLAQETDDALRSLRGLPISLPRGLASQTQFRVRLRAREMREAGPHRRLLWITVAMSWALGVASAPYVWTAFQWIGLHTGAPRIVLQFGFGLWWAIPALVAAAVILMENAKQAYENNSAPEEK